jgi:hypothetical protein
MRSEGLRRGCGGRLEMRLGSERLACRRAQIPRTANTPRLDTMSRQWPRPSLGFMPIF